MSITLEESARRAGTHHWAESRIFELLGSWVPGMADPELGLILDRHSHHAAWRAREWWDRMPVLADLDRAALSVPPSTPARVALERLATVEGDANRLAAAYRFALPRLWATYDRYQVRLVAGDGAVSDGSSLRTVGLVAPDLAADWREGETALQQVLRSRPEIREAAGTVTALEELLTG
jgi:hypothetical protein